MLRNKTKKRLLTGVTILSALLAVGCSNNKKVDQEKNTESSANEKVESKKDVKPSKDKKESKVGELTPSEYQFYRKNTIDAFTYTAEESTDLDLSKDLSKQKYNDKMTWEEYFDKKTDEFIASIKNLNDKIKEENFKVDREELYKKYLASITEQARLEGKESDQWIKDNFGKDATEENLKNVIEDFMSALQYRDAKMDEYRPSEKEILECYEENKDKIDNYTFRVVEFPKKGNLQTNEEKNKPSKEELAKAKKKAKEDAEKFLERLTTEDDMKKQFTKNFGDTSLDNNGSVTPDDSLVSKASTYSILNDYTAWLTDKDRKYGDKTLIDSEESDSYSVLFFIEREKPTEEMASIRQLVINMGDVSGRPEESFKSKTEYEENQKKVAEKRQEIKEKTIKILNEWNDSEKNEDAFIKIFDKYSEYTDVDKGLFMNQPESNFIEEIRKWVFDKNRKPNDMKAFATDDYTTFIFVKSKDGETWRKAAEIILKDNFVKSFFNFDD